jgi:hypothetical protein
MTDVQAVDPLLFLSASLFIIGLGLICLRLFPYAVKLFFLLGRRLWSPSMAFCRRRTIYYDFFGFHNVNRDFFCAGRAHN